LNYLALVYGCRIFEEGAKKYIKGLYVDEFIKEELH